MDDAQDNSYAAECKCKWCVVHLTMNLCSIVWQYIVKIWSGIVAAPSAVWNALKDVFSFSSSKSVDND